MFETQTFKTWGGELALQLADGGRPGAATAPAAELSKSRFLGLGVALVIGWWVAAALAMVAISTVLGLKPQDYDADVPYLELALLSVVVAPLVENALAIGVFRLARRFVRPTWALAATVLLIAALHLIYAWRALAAVGLFAAVLASYVIWERRSMRFAWISGMVLHAAFNLTPTVIVGLARAGVLK